MSLLVLSIAIMFAANLLRCYRWQLLINTYEKPSYRNLFLATGVGFLVNSLVPYKLGEIARGVIAGKKMKNGIGFTFATIIVERCFDIIVIGILFAILGILGQGFQSALFYCVIAVVLVLLLVLAYVFRHQLKKVLKVICGLFNDALEFRLMRFFWALICSFQNIFKRIDKVRLLGSTVAMWLLYLFSYAVFARGMSSANSSLDFLSVFNMLFSEKGVFLNTVSSNSFNISSAWASALFLLIPSVLLIIAGILVKDVNKDSVNDARTYLNLIPHLNPDEQLRFMELYFSDDRRSYVETYLHINQKVQIIRDYSSGSNATTMLCTDGKSTFFRKYAFSTDGDKLYDQIEWLKKYQGILPITEVSQYEKAPQYCYYDMPFTGNTVSMFEYAHSAPVEKSWDMLETILTGLKDTLYHIDCRKADEETIRKYAEGKVAHNIETIKASAQIQPLLAYDTLVINGVEYPNLDSYAGILTEGHLCDVFRNDEYAAIHGDFTIENIVVRPEDESYYLIDPNTGNVHDSPNLDYAKLLQSIHGGYEFLMRTKEISVSGNKVIFPDLYSEVYRELCHRYDAFLTEHFSPAQVRSIYYHEIVHWLRLLPYKLRKDGDRAVLFYARLLMLLKELTTRFDYEG